LDHSKVGERKKFRDLAGLQNTRELAPDGVERAVMTRHKCLLSWSS
jgi:hypothetical protein